MKTWKGFGLALLALWTAALICVAGQQQSPNILIIMADDLGFGDTSCYGASRIKTPNIDRLAKQGLRFTDAHSTSATCTPSRYGFLTGQYPWRKQGTGILPGDAALIIDVGQATIASMLHKGGYRTGVIGKWHLGLGQKGGPDWNGDIKPGPLEIGFDYCFLMPATGDRVPCVFVENHRVAGLDPADPIKVSFAEKVGNEPLGRDHPELLKLHPSHGHDQTIINGISRIGYMSGGKAARWVDEEMADTFVKKAKSFLGTAQTAGQPFFLYFATHDPHVPRVPHPRFVGKSGCGIRGDAIVEFDWCVGELLDTLEKHGNSKGTMVILTSDNGPVVDDGYKDGAVENLNGHKPAGQFRGGKYSIFEGGTRVPFIVSWPGHVRPGATAALFSQIDLFASLAVLAGQKLQAGEAPNSRNKLAVLMGQGDEEQRIVEHANVLALRNNEWKYIQPGRGPRRNVNTNTEMGNDPGGQLYDLSRDPAETENVIKEKPEKASQLREELQKVQQRER